VPAPVRIVRVLSASTRETVRVKRSRGARSRRRSAGRRQTAFGAPGQRPPATPVPAAELVAAAAGLRPLLAELAALSGGGQEWSLRVLRRNVELALLSPESLETAENQLDFIEELAEAAWDGSVRGLRQLAGGPGGAGAEARREAIAAELDELADRLCGQAESWQRHRSAFAEDPASDAGREADDPQPEHRL